MAARTRRAETTVIMMAPGNRSVGDDKNARPAPGCGRQSAGGCAGGERVQAWVEKGSRPTARAGLFGGPVSTQDRSPCRFPPGGGLLRSSGPRTPLEEVPDAHADTA